MLPPKPAGRDGVFYALSCTYLTSSGDWNVYLESAAPAVVFVDGQRVLVRGPNATGTRREIIHADSGYHMVMVKFVAQAAPFRVAILPPNSGSRRKNSTPYLETSPDSEDLQAAAERRGRSGIFCRVPGCVAHLDPHVGNTLSTQTPSMTPRSAARSGAPPSTRGSLRG